MTVTSKIDGREVYRDGSKWRYKGTGELVNSGLSVSEQDFLSDAAHTAVDHIERNGGKHLNERPSVETAGIFLNHFFRQCDEISKRLASDKK